MKTLCLFETFPPVFNHNKPWKPASLGHSNSLASKSGSRCNSFKFADQCVEHVKKENHVPRLVHLKSFSKMHDMMLKFMGSNRSLNLASNKFDFRLDIIQDIIREHYSCTSLKDNCASFRELGIIPKMALLSCIILTFLTSQQAFATPEFTSGLQSPSSFFEDLGDINTGFASAFLLIFFSELGDKTFFIAALLAARNSGVVVFAGTFGALATMTIVSVILGRTFHYVDGILPFSLGGTDFPLDDFAAVCLLVYFGVTTLLDAASGDESKIKEEQEEAELAISELRGNGVGITAASSTVISTFLLVFVAEWGDKSFFSTIALAASSSPLGVIGGSLAGHAFATSLAVLGGSILGTYFSEKVIAYIGGTLFLVFAGITLVEILS